MKRQTLQQRGFTLIELLVVIAIIGLLASTVLASLNQARVRAQSSVVQQDLRLIQNAIFMAEPYTAPLLSITGTGCSACSCPTGTDLRGIADNSTCMTRWTLTLQRIAAVSPVLDTNTGHFVIHGGRLICWMRMRANLLLIRVAMID